MQPTQFYHLLSCEALFPAGSSHRCTLPSLCIIYFIFIPLIVKQSTCSVRVNEELNKAEEAIGFNRLLTPFLYGGFQNAVSLPRNNPPHYLQPITLCAVNIEANLS